MSKHSHSHGHHHGDHDADRYTTATAIYDAFTGFLGDGYSYGTLLNLICNFPTNTAKASIGFGIGAVIGVFSGVGSAIAHRYLNTAHQTTKKKKSELSETDRLVLGDDAAAKDHPDVEQAAPPSLTRAQIIALIGDYIAHMGEKAAVPILIADLVTSYATNIDSDTARYTGIGVRVGALLAGGFFAYPDFRSCKNAILDANASPNLTH